LREAHDAVAGDKSPISVLSTALRRLDLARAAPALSGNRAAYANSQS